MRKLIVVVGVLVVLVGGAIALFFVLFNPDAQRAALEQRLQEAFGRPAHVGPMHLSLRGGLGLEVQGMSIERDPSFGEGDLLQVDSVRVDVGVWDYILRRQLTIKNIRLERPHLTLVKREDGVWNWTILGAQPDGGAQTAARATRGVLVPVLAAAITPPDAVGAAMNITPKRIEIASAEVTIINRSEAPQTETVYANLSLSASVDPEEGGYHAVGQVQADSAASGGEPLAASFPFDAHLVPPVGAHVWQARGNIPSGTFATRNLRLDSIASDISLDESQTLRLDSMHVGLYGGQLEGHLALDLATPANQCALSIGLDGVSMGDALAPRPDLAGSLRGKLSAAFEGSGELGDFNSTLASLVGTGHAEVDEAQLTSLNVMSEIARQGHLGDLEFNEPGTRADHVDAQVRMESGRLYIDKATVSSINGYADMEVDSGWIDTKYPASIELEGTAILLPKLFAKVAESDPATSFVLSTLRSKAQPRVPLSIAGPLGKPHATVRWASILKPILPFGPSLFPRK